MKVLLKTLMSDRQIEMIREEISVMSMLDHANVIKYIESFEDSRYLYIVMEYIPASEDLNSVLEGAYKVFDTSGTKPLLPIDDVRKIMKMILMGVSHIHANRIVHRDLKPGNIIFYNHQGKLQLKIIDFGLALELDRVDQRERGMLLGTPAFMAPEIFNERGATGVYKEPIDVWACGVIMFQMLAGKLPFSSENPDDLVEMIRNDVVNIEGCPTLTHVPGEVKSLLRRMLNKNAHQRISAA